MSSTGVTSRIGFRFSRPRGVTRGPDLLSSRQWTLNEHREGSAKHTPAGEAPATTDGSSMAEDEKQTTQGSSIARRGSGGSATLGSDRGATNIATTVVTKVAGIAAREVPGVHDLGGGASRAIGSVTQRVGIGDERSQGVAVEVGEKEAAVDLTIVVEYGESIPEISKAIRDNVIQRIEGITGLTTTEVNISVNDLYFPGDDQPDTPPPAPRVE